MTNKLQGFSSGGWDGGIRNLLQGFIQPSKQEHWAPSTCKCQLFDKTFSGLHIKITNSCPTFYSTPFIPKYITNVCLIVYYLFLLLLTQRLDQKNVFVAQYFIQYLACERPCWVQTLKAAWRSGLSRRWNWTLIQMPLILYITHYILKDAPSSMHFSPICGPIDANTFLSHLPCICFTRTILLYLI